MYFGFFLGLLVFIAIIPMHESTDTLATTCTDNSECKDVLGPTCCKPVDAGDDATGLCVPKNTCCGKSTDNQKTKCSGNSTCCSSLGLCVSSKAQCGNVCNPNADSEDECAGSTPKCCTITVGSIMTGACQTPDSCF